MRFVRDILPLLLCLGLCNIPHEASAGPRRTKQSLEKKNKKKGKAAAVRRARSRTRTRTRSGLKKPRPTVKAKSVTRRAASKRVRRHAASMVKASPRAKSVINQVKKTHRAKSATKRVKKRARARVKSRASRCRGKKCKKRRRSTRDRWPPMTLKSVNTRETLTARLYDKRGHTVKATLRKLRKFLRCHVTNKRRTIDWRLIRKIYRVSRQYPGKPLIVYSGYRARKVSRSGSSRHVRGKAIDFRVEGVSKRTLRDFLMKTFSKVGVGYYPNSPFIHLDVREKRSAFWVDFSGKGELPRYAPDPIAYLRRDRKNHRKGGLKKKAIAQRTPLKPKPTSGGDPAARATPAPGDTSHISATKKPMAKQPKVAAMASTLVHTPVGEILSPHGLAHQAASSSNTAPKAAKQKDKSDSSVLSAGSSKPPAPRKANSDNEVRTMSSGTTVRKRSKASP